MNKIIIVIFLFFSVFQVNGQSSLVDSTNFMIYEKSVSIDSTNFEIHAQNVLADSTNPKFFWSNALIDSTKEKSLKFKYKSLIIPTALIGYGVIGLTDPSLREINISTKNDLRGFDDKKLKIDDFAQYSSFLSVYGLNAIGIQGKHNFKDRTIILGTAYLLMGSSVNILKRTTKVTRPDGSSSTSFPSGHTATAFMGAEFLYQEYKDISVWYGIAGYVVATGTGLFRIYNERHWLTDIAAGAGIGILSTKIAYWMHPWMKRTFFKDKEKTTGIVMPFYNGREYGLGLSLRF